MTLCDPMDGSTPGFPVSWSLPKHLHGVGDAIQPSHPLLPPSPSALNLSQPASGSFQMSWLFISGGQNIGASALASALPIIIQGWFPLGWNSLISLLSKGLSKVFCRTTIQKHQFLGCSAFFMVQLSHLYMTTGKTKDLTIQTFASKWCLCFLICCLGLS